MTWGESHDGGITWWREKDTLSIRIKPVILWDSEIRWYGFRTVSNNRITASPFRTTWLENYVRFTATILKMKMAEIILADLRQSDTTGKLRRSVWPTSFLSRKLPLLKPRWHNSRNDWANITSQNLQSTSVVSSRWLYSSLDSGNQPPNHARHTNYNPSKPLLVCWSMQLWKILLNYHWHDRQSLSLYYVPPFKSGIFIGYHKSNPSQCWMESFWIENLIWSYPEVIQISYL